MDQFKFEMRGRRVMGQVLFPAGVSVRTPGSGIFIAPAGLGARIEA